MPHAAPILAATPAPGARADPRSGRNDDRTREFGLLARTNPSRCFAKRTRAAGSMADVTNDVRRDTNEPGGRRAKRTRGAAKRNLHERNSCGARTNPASWSEADPAERPRQTCRDDMVGQRTAAMPAHSLSRRCRPRRSFLHERFTETA